MIDLKPHKNSDLAKFKVFFDEMGIEYEQVGYELEIAPHYFDGRDGLIVKFYDDESFNEFMDISPRDIELHEISKTLKEILREMRKRH